MKLYSAAASPFARKVRVCLLELGIENQVEFIDAAATPVAPNDMLIMQNPLGKIPCLISDDGMALYDSRVITRYLNDCKKGALYPKGAKLWEALTLEATADGMMEAAVLMVYEKRFRPKEMVYDIWLEAQWDKVERALDALESGWEGHLDGPLDMAQIAVGVVLEYLDFRHGDRDWRKGRDALAKWQAAFAKRDAMQKTQPSM
ncbi:MAG: glutathione S-transferase [Proteobacteria bacterium]|nr:glutathione S-transferase [Pseudomonadota bacterium]